MLDGAGTFYKRESQYLNNIVKSDEKQLYYYNVPTKSQNNVWAFNDEDSSTACRIGKKENSRSYVVHWTPPA